MLIKVLISLSWIYLASNAYSQDTRQSNKIDSHGYYYENIAGQDTIYLTPEKEPQFPGGAMGYHKFIAKNLKWPNDGMDVQGRILIDFVVEKDGKLTNIRVVRGIEKMFDAEALRVIKLSPKWQPGTINGKEVRSKYEVSVKFDLSED